MLSPSYIEKSLDYQLINFSCQNYIDYSVILLNEVSCLYDIHVPLIIIKSS